MWCCLVVIHVSKRVEGVNVEKERDETQRGGGTANGGLVDVDKVALITTLDRAANVNSETTASLVSLDDRTLGAWFKWLLGWLRGLGDHARVLWHAMIITHIKVSLFVCLQKRERTRT